MISIRPYRETDLDALYAISLATGHLGGDASYLYANPEMMGQIYSAPYAVLEPSLVLVAVDDAGVAGFVLGTPDTKIWENRLEREWWPVLREKYPEPSEASASDWSIDQRRAHMIYHPAGVPAAVCEAFPAHMHMNLLPRVQGKGLGSRLMEAWFELARKRDVAKIHVGANRGNEKAIRFWGRSGFAEIESEGRTVWMGRDID